MKTAASVIGLYNYTSGLPADRAVFGRLYVTLRDCLRGIGAAPTYYSIAVSGGSEKLSRFNDKADRTLLEKGFEGADVITFNANPPGSSSPAYDFFAAASFDSSRAAEILVFYAEDEYVDFGSLDFDKLLVRLLGERTWDFGYAFSWPKERNPYFHVLALDDAKRTAEEYRRLRLWYAAPPQLRLMKLRDVYEYNIVNDLQLSHRLNGELGTLRSYIEAGCGHFEPVGPSRWLWKLGTNEIEGVRSVLARSGALITA